MKWLRHISGLGLLLAVIACGKMQQHASPDELQEAKAQYDSGFVCLQHDSLMQAFPHFIQVAGKLEYLPEDMTDEEMLLASRAYYQMAHVFKRKIENNAEIDALRWALGYQKRIQNTTWMVWTTQSLASAFQTIMEDDSARIYLNWVMPYLDTVSDNVWDYIGAQQLLSSLYFDKQKLDSSLAVQRDIRCGPSTTTNATTPLVASLKCSTRPIPMPWRN